MLVESSTYVLKVKEVYQLLFAVGSQANSSQQLISDDMQQGQDSSETEDDEVFDIKVNDVLWPLTSQIKAKRESEAEEIVLVTQAEPILKEALSDNNLG